LLRRLETARKISNELLSEALRRVDRMRESVEFRRLRAELVVSKQKTAARRRASAIGTGPHPPAKTFAEPEDRSAAWNALRERFGLRSAYDLGPYATELSQATTRSAQRSFSTPSSSRHGARSRTMRSVAPTGRAGRAGADGATR